jgi:hypothetical protein
MKLKKKKRILSLGFIILIAFLSVGFTIAKVHFNNINPVFMQGPGRIAVEKTMIEGANLYLKGSSQLFLFISEFENNQLNFDEANKYLKSSSSFFYDSFSKYNDAYNLGKKIGYFKENINKMKNFNYDKISINFKNKIIFNSAVQLFKNGDALGLYRKNMSYTTQIILNVNKILEKLKNKEEPTISEVQDLSELIYENGYYGNYATKIGKMVLK